MRFNLFQRRLFPEGVINRRDATRMGFDKLVGVEARLLITPPLAHVPIDEEPVIHKKYLDRFPLSDNFTHRFSGRPNFLMKNKRRHGSHVGGALRAATDDGLPGSRRIAPLLPRLSAVGGSANGGKFPCIE